MTGLIGEAFDVTEKFKNADLFAQLRSQLNTIMNGSSASSNSTTDNHTHEGSDVQDEDEEETLSGVKAAVLYDNNAIMLGKQVKNNSLYIHIYK